MGSPEQIQILFGKIDQLNTGISGVRDDLGELRGDVRVLSAKMEQKAEKNDISKEIQLHSMECNTRKPSGFWSGMNATQKTAVVGSIITAVGSAIVMILKDFS